MFNCALQLQLCLDATRSHATPRCKDTPRTLWVAAPLPSPPSYYASVPLKCNAIGESESVSESEYRHLKRAKREQYNWLLTNESQLKLIQNMNRVLFTRLTLTHSHSLALKHLEICQTTDWHTSKRVSKVWRISWCKAESKRQLGEQEREQEREREWVREQGHTMLHISASINLVFVILLNIDWPQQISVWTEERKMSVFVWQHSCDALPLSLSLSTLWCLRTCDANCEYSFCCAFFRALFIHLLVLLIAFHHFPLDSAQCQCSLVSRSIGGGRGGGGFFFLGRLS